MKIQSLKQTFLSLIILVLSTQSWGWGTKGHETIEEVATGLMPRSNFSILLKHNMRAVKFLSMVPDMSWKHGSEPHPLEGQSHFFQIDYYVPRGGKLNPNINYYIERAGDPSELLKKGTAPWRMEQMSWLLVQTLKKPRVSATEVIQVAATLGHYVGDIGNPLHVAADYDGVQIGEKGLHAFFETVTVNEIPDNILFEAVNRAASMMIPKIPDRLRPVTGAFQLAKAANDEASIVLSNAKRYGQTRELQQRMKPIIVDTMAMSAAILAKIWNEAYVLAGSPALETDNLGRLPVPGWVPVNYIKGIRTR